MYADIFKGLKDLPATMAPKLFVERQQEFEVEEEEEEAVEVEEKEEEDAVEPPPLVPLKMNVVAPSKLGCSDKTGMKYFRELQCFFRPNYLATGGLRSPNLTEKGIEILARYSKMRSGDRYQYKQQLHVEYQKWCDANGVNREETNAIDLQVSQLLYEQIKSRLPALLEQEAENLVEESGARELGAKFAIKIKTAFYEAVEEQLQENNNDNEEEG